MDLATFLHERRSDWRRLEELLTQAEGSGLSSLDEEQVVEFGQIYRRTAADLNQAQTFVSGESTQRYLNELVARAYLLIHGADRVPRHFSLTPIFTFLRLYPRVFRRNWRPILLAAVLFLGGTVFGYLASWYDRDTARAFLLPTNMPTIQPEQEGSNQTPAQTSGEFTAYSSFLFTNNVTVTLSAFALGLTLGVGSAWLMFYNGVLLGALWAVFAEANQHLAFATGILPHGVLEIPAMLLGGAAGFILAEGIIWARPWPRAEELGRCGREALFLVAGAVPLLAAAALLEAEVARAPDWFLGKGIKLAVAGVVGLLFLAYVLLPGWGSQSRQKDEGQA